ncbi:zinc finger protein 250-like [Enoplosus armatus]|uniref:zinc finger protein 250-like n=1 Tax=Enoplosus armatus TaxID=215367 RepID=UPI003995CDE9
MSRLQGLKVFINQRLTAAVDEIFGHVERTITEYEEELDRRHRKLLDVVLKPEIKLRRADCPADVQQLSVSKEEVPPEQQDWSPSLDQEDPEPPRIKEEQEELWTTQEGEQLRGLEEVKEEDDEDEAQSSQLHQPPASSSTGQMETGTDGEDCEGPEPARNSDPDKHLQPVSDDKASESSDAETEVSDDGSKETRDLNPLKRNDVPVSDVTFNAAKKSFICCECGRKFGRKDSLRRHMRFHTGEKPYSCSVCGKRFSQRPNLIRHMRCHSGEKPFSCSFCDTSFAVRSALVNHMRIHTGEKPFSCLYCDKSFTQKGGLKKHMTVHTGEKPYSCPVCDKSFSQKANLTYHFSVHTGQKQFSCSVCDKRFTWQSQVKSHKCVGESSNTVGAKLPFLTTDCAASVKMSRLQGLKVFINQRLTAAVDEIFGHVERTITEYEEELDRRHRKLLDVVLKPEIKLRRAECPADVQRLSVSKEEVPPEQQDWSPSLDQEDPPEPPHIKEEQEELWTSQEGGQLRGLEEADITRFTFKSEDDEDEEKPQSSQLHQSQTEQMETEADGEDCGGPGPARNSDPDRHLEPVSDDKTSDSSETEDSDRDWRETRDPQSGLNSPSHNEVPVSGMTPVTGEKLLHSCSECGKRFGNKTNLKIHMRIHTGEHSFSCLVCGRIFAQGGNLRQHMAVHTGGKRLRCSLCDKRFTWYKQFKSHKCVGESSQLHQRADGEDCGGPEPARNSDPDRHLEPDTDDMIEDSSETEDSDDWKETREPHFIFTRLKQMEGTVEDQNQPGTQIQIDI